MKKIWAYRLAHAVIRRTDNSGLLERLWFESGRGRTHWDQSPHTKRRKRRDALCGPPSDLLVLVDGSSSFYSIGLIGLVMELLIS